MKDEGRRQMFRAALASMALLIWALSGDPVSPLVAAFSGGVCGWCWALAWAAHCIDKADTLAIPSPENK